MVLVFKKRKIIKFKEHIGGDITSSLISKIPYELHLRDTSFKKYSYCGH